MSNAAVCYRSSIENWSPQICGKHYVGNTKMEGMELEQKAFKKRFGKIISECFINISPKRNGLTSNLLNFPAL